MLAQLAVTLKESKNLDASYLAAMRSPEVKMGDVFEWVPNPKEWIPEFGASTHHFSGASPN